MSNGFRTRPCGSTLGENWGLDPIASAHRIALHGRGGYCSHLNGAFAELLDSLGYHVHRHVGGVHGPDGPDAAGGWRLKHDPKGGFHGMVWTNAEATWGDFAAQHDYLSTAPDSGFVRISAGTRPASLSCAA